MHACPWMPPRCWLLRAQLYFSLRHIFAWVSRRMDTLGIEPRASRMLSGCDTTTPRALDMQLGQVCSFNISLDLAAARPGLVAVSDSIDTALRHELCSKVWPSGWVHVWCNTHLLPGQIPEEQVYCSAAALMSASMDTLGIEPRASRMLSGCDTTTPRALEMMWRPSF